MKGTIRREIGEVRTVPLPPAPSVPSYTSFNDETKVVFASSMMRIQKPKIFDSFSKAENAVMRFVVFLCGMLRGVDG